MLAQRLPLEMMQQRWAAELNPLLANPLTQGHLLTGVALVNGTTVIDHKLGRKLVGWLLVGIDAAASIYDGQASNQTPELTLQLVSNAAATATLWVF